MHTTVKKIQSFLGFIQHFYKFIRIISAIVETLHNLTFKNKSFA